LCPDCRELQPISEAEAELLAPFTESPPDEVAHPVGCRTCGGSGFLGKKALFEVIEFDPETAALLGEGVAIADVRQWARESGTGLLADAGLNGIRDRDFPVRDVYEDLLLEDLDRMMAARVAWSTPARASASDAPDERDDVRPVGAGQEDQPPTADGPSVLVVEDDLDTRVLVERLLSGAGYRVSSAEDGAAALMKLATEPPDLILSDIHMPNLDGMKLLELVHQHGIEAPVVLLTAEESDEVERRSHQLGAKDYLRKPVDKAVLLESLGRVLSGEGA
jgi:CheY-like chemotaxis protein